MNILFAAPENAWGGFLGMVKKALPAHRFRATGGFCVDSLAGVDVFWEEPPDPGDPIFRLNVMATPHIGGSTDISMQGIVAGVVENIQRLESGRTPLNCA